MSRNHVIPLHTVRHTIHPFPPNFLKFVSRSYLKRAFQTSTELSGLLQRTSDTKSNLRRRGLFRYGSSIGTACLIDVCAELCMESFCLIINLWMVFGANKPIDMVLNSLALEFIKSIGSFLHIVLFLHLTRSSDNEFCNFFM